MSLVCLVWLKCCHLHIVNDYSLCCITGIPFKFACNILSREETWSSTFTNKDSILDSAQMYFKNVKYNFLDLLELDNRFLNWGNSWKYQIAAHLIHKPIQTPCPFCFWLFRSLPIHLIGQLIHICLVSSCYLWSPAAAYSILDPHLPVWKPGYSPVCSVVGEQLT